MTEALATSEHVLRVPLDRLHPSPSNPRKHLGDLTELAASIAQVGVLEPLVARPSGDDFEIAFGHRRYAAAEKAGVEDVPVIVRDYSDDEVLEAQITENSQRENPHPLDEADGYAALLKRNYTAQRIADRIGRPVTYVAQRLKLCELSKECRKALDEERITLAVALLLARIPDAKLQAEALEEVGGDRWDGPMKADEARRVLEERFLLRLDQAPFDIASATLVPKAGACTACPKRTGQQRELFADVKSPDLCTDPVCHRGKVDALWKLSVKAAKTSGVEVLDGKAADKAMTYSGGYRKLTDKEWLDGGKQKTVKQLLGKELPPVTLARGTDGVVHELVKRADFEKVLKEKDPGRAPQKTGPSAVAKRQREKELVASEASKRLISAIVAAVEVRTVWSGVEIDLLRGLALCTRTSVWSEYVTKALKRRGWDKVPEEASPPKGKPKKRSAWEPEDVFEARVMAASAGELMGLVVELLVGRELPGKHRDETETGAALACGALGVSFERELAAVQAERSAKAKAPKVTRPVGKSSPSDDKPKKKAKAKAKTKPKAKKE